MASFLRDVQFALRSLRRSPGLVAAASVSLSLGIAACVMIFAGLDILIWQPLPYPQADRLVQVWSANPERGWDESSISLADFADWREQAQGVRIAAYGSAAFNLAEGQTPERVSGLRVSPSFFDLLGVAPALGRSFRPDEETPGQGSVVMLTHGLWTRRYGADSTMLGRSLRLNGTPHEVIGILPESFSFGFGNDLYTPLSLDPSDNRGNRSYEAIGRLDDGMTLDGAQRTLDGVAARLAELHPMSNRGMETRLVPLKDEVVGEEAVQAGTISMIAALFVLLIACANVANLLLARGAVRERELAVRSALGAGRRVLLRQLLVEGTLLSLVGGVLGIALSGVGLGWLTSILPPDVARIDDLTIGGRALGFGLLLTFASGIGFSLAPALHSTDGKLVSSLHEGGRGSVSRGAGRLRSAFVIGELGLALVLLISSGLLIKAAIRMQQQPLGFDPNGALTFRVGLPEEEFADSGSVGRLLEQLTDRLEAQPSVRAAGVVSRLPMTGGSGTYYAVEGEDVDEDQRPVAQFRYASPGYLASMAIPLTRGRWFDAADQPGSANVVVVNEALERRHFAASDPVGHRLIFGSGAYDIVGVVGDTPEFGRDDPPPPLVFFSVKQRARPASFAVVVRTDGDAASLGPAARNALAEIAPSVPAYDMVTLSRLVAREEQSEMIMPKLLSMFGVMALILAVVGVYGVMTYVVSTRSTEMGIRRALGAQPGDILGMVLQQSARLAGLGAVIGVGLSLLMARGLSSFLLGVSPFDPAVFGGVTLALVTAALAATILPARRASTVAPTEALRGD